MSTSNNAINNTVGASISGVTNTLTITNPSNTGSSAARTSVTVGGGTAGDPTLNFNINGVTDWEMGIDNNSNDDLKISQSTSLGTNDTWIMTTAGERTMPLQPAFRAYKSANTANATGDGTNVTVVFDMENVDQNNDFDTTTGLFTAPVDGFYVFSALVAFQPLTASHTRGDLQFLLNGTPIANGTILNVGAVRELVGQSTNLTATMGYFLSSGDTFGVEINVSGSTKTVAIAGDAGGVSTYFSGFLSC